ncbi:MAG: YcfL family protein [Verrucomicrobiota bacterium]
MKASLILSISVILLLLLGCSTPTNTIERETGQATPNLVDARIDVFDSNLEKRLSLVSVNEATAGDLLQVQVTFRNRQVRPRSFAYQFQWIQQNGMMVTSPKPIWRPSSIEGGQTISIAATAPNPNVVDFRLSLRETN